MQHSTTPCERSDRSSAFLSKRGSLYLSAALVVLGLGLPSQAGAWEFDENNCPTGKEVESKTSQFAETQPQVYMMLDRSGSMTGHVKEQRVPVCEGSYNSGQTHTSRTFQLDDGGDSRTAKFGYGGEQSKTFGEAGIQYSLCGADKESASFNDYGFSSSPNVFVTTQTVNGGQDPSAAHAESVGTGGFTTQHCEYDGEGNCDGHNCEDNGWVAIDRDKMSEIDGMDAGRVTVRGSHNNGTHKTVNFSNDIENTPYLFTQIITEDGGDNPLNSQALNVDSNSGTVEFCEEEDGSGCDGHTSERMAWWALDPKKVTNENDDGIDFGKFTTSGSGWERVYFSENFSTTPVVVADVQTENDGDEAVYPEVRDVSSSSALIRFCEHQGDSGGWGEPESNGCSGHSSEEVAWFAAEPGQISVKTGKDTTTKTKTIQHSGDDLTFSFDNVDTNASGKVPVTVRLEGDFDGDGSRQSCADRGDECISGASCSKGDCIDREYKCEYCTHTEYKCKDGCGDYDYDCRERLGCDDWNYDYHYNKNSPCSNYDSDWIQYNKTCDPDYSCKKKTSCDDWNYKTDVKGSSCSSYSGWSKTGRGKFCADYDWECRKKDHCDNWAYETYNSAGSCGGDQRVDKYCSTYRYECRARREGTTWSRHPGWYISWWVEFWTYVTGKNNCPDYYYFGHYHFDRFRDHGMWFRSFTVGPFEVENGNWNEHVKRKGCVNYDYKCKREDYCKDWDYKYDTKFSACDNYSGWEKTGRGKFCDYHNWECRKKTSCNDWNYRYDNKEFSCDLYSGWETHNGRYCNWKYDCKEKTSCDDWNYESHDDVEDSCASRGWQRERRYCDQYAYNWQDGWCDSSERPSGKTTRCGGTAYQWRDSCQGDETSIGTRCRTDCREACNTFECDSWNYEENEFADIYADGDKQDDMCKNGSCGNRCGSYSKTIEVPKSKIQNGTLELEVDTSNGVDDLGNCANEVEVSIPSTYTTPLPQQCVSTRYQVKGDFNLDREYASLELEGNDEGTFCDGNDGCQQCGGYHTTYRKTSESQLADSKLTATVETSNAVNVCSNETRMSVVDYTEGATNPIDYDCPSCSTQSDCLSNLPNSLLPGDVRDCAANISSLDSRLISSQSKWDVATNSIDSIVTDMTNSNPDDAEFGLGMFNDNAWNEVTPQEDAASKINNALASESPGGITNMEDAIETSITQLEQAAKKLRVQASILITDGLHNTSDETNVIRAACKHRDKQGRLYVVGFRRGADTQFNDALAAAGGTGVCCTGGSQSNCDRFSNNYVDPCDLSDSELDSYNEGRNLTCKGSYEASSQTKLTTVIGDIASNLSCTIDVSNFGKQRWQRDPEYYCGEDYDCFKVSLPGLGPGGTSKRIYHLDSDQAPRGWKWNGSNKTSIRLTDHYCKKVRDELSQQTVEVDRACMCSISKRGQTCTYGKNVSGIPRQCRCTMGEITCSGGFDTCSQYNNNQCPSGDLEKHGEVCNSTDDDCDGQVDENLSDPCPKQDGVCSGASVSCSGGSYPDCSTSDYEAATPTGVSYEPGSERTCDGYDNDCDGQVDEDLTSKCPLQQGVCAGSTSQCKNGRFKACGPAVYGPNYEKVEKTCDGLDNDCDGLVDEGLTKKCDNQKGVCDGSTVKCTGGTYPSCGPKQYGSDYETPEATCDQKDNDCDGRVDEGLSGEPCDTGEPGRCEDGTTLCQNGSVTCEPKRRPMPEICNGLDDDCDGTADNIEESWESKDWNVTIDNGSSLTCRRLSTCNCGPSDADDKHRGGQEGNTLDQEFDEMVQNTQSTCSCSE